MVDADQISRKSTVVGGCALPKLVGLFGPEIIAADGSLDRTYARQRTFSDSGFREQLQSVIHPLVQQEIQRIEEDSATKNVPLLVFDIPLLVESSTWRKRLDRILVVDCSESTQIQRVHSRNGLAPEEVQSIMRVQASRLQRLAAADIVVCNDGISLTELEKECQQVGNILRLQKLAKDSA